MQRRQFLQGFASLAGGLTAASITGAERARVPYEQDLAIYNGKFITLSPAQPEASAALVIAGRIVAIGSNQEIRRRAGRTRETIALGAQ